MEKIDKKYLKGLKYHSSEGKDVLGENGRKLKQYTHKERALTPDDVLSWEDKGREIVLVTADGQKVTVPKTSGAEA
ncbi:MAG: hypothetical protein IH614_17075 [Desulfuromonadales bacterium]|nr:hypothetical protein [Desulfuromonadales bacterium]